MLDFRPVGYVVGLLVFGLGVSMLFPMLWDSYQDNGHWFIFLESALLTCTIGGLMALASANGVVDRLSIQQTFILTTSVWLALPFFGSLPFYLGNPGLSFVDSFFEAMSGLTTTGSTVLVGIDELPEGLSLIHISEPTRPY